jgi:DNA end-binding protein Ku
MVIDWQPEKYRDEYRHDLLTLIKAKAKSRGTEAVEEPPPPAKESRGAEVVDLMALLEKSLEGKGRTASERRARARDHRARKTA